MDAVYSPPEYTDSAMCIQYTTGLSLCIVDPQGKCWDGSQDSLDVLNQEWSADDELSIQYIPQDEAIILYLSPDSNRTIKLTSKTGVRFFFAEVNEEATITGETSDDEYPISENGVSLSRVGKGLRIDGIENEEDSEEETHEEDTDPTDPDIAEDQTKTDGDGIDVTDDSDISSQQQIAALQKLVTQLCNDNYNGAYQEIQVLETDRSTQELYRLKMRLGQLRAEVANKRRNKENVEEQISGLSQELEELQADLAEAESLRNRTQAEVTPMEKQLQEILAELGIDSQALKLYRQNGDDNLEKLLTKAEELMREIRNSLRSRVEFRQSLCDGIGRMNASAQPGKGV